MTVEKPSNATYLLPFVPLHLTYHTETTMSSSRSTSEDAEEHHTDYYVDATDDNDEEEEDSDYEEDGELDVDDMGLDLFEGEDEFHGAHSWVARDRFAPR